MEVVRIESLVLRHCSLERACVVYVRWQESNLALTQLENPGHGAKPYPSFAPATSTV